MWHSSPVHACSNEYLLRALQLHPNTTLPAWTLSSACCYLCRFAFTWPLEHCGRGGLSITPVPRMVVVFLWFCLYVPCTGYTVFICRERIYGVRSDTKCIFTAARGARERCACAPPPAAHPRVTRLLLCSSPAWAWCATSQEGAGVKTKVISTRVDFWKKLLQGSLHLASHFARILTRRKTQTCSPAPFVSEAFD